MTPAERWARIASLFDAVVDKGPAERESVVHASGEPRDIQDEVLSLLAAHEGAGEFLSPAGRPASARAPNNSELRRSEPALPTDLGHYRITRVIGEGGMGVVYQAEDTHLHRIVALKLLSPELAGDARQRERLKQEARAAAALSHPGIATVYALEEIDDHIVIASEYLDGESLRAEIDRGPMTPERALPTAVDLARAMAAAHERGIVHRDLKPENILRTRDGVVKILDFGLAQFESAGKELVSMTLTEAGFVAGTPPYMAPEQLLGQATDFRTDHFAFGVLLYEMFTGQHPFGGSSLPSTIARILAADPNAPESPQRLPELVWEIVNRCVQKNPSERYQATNELVEALESIRAAGVPDARSLSGGVALDPPYKVEGTRAGAAEWWWRFHQLAAAIVYWAMVWPAWHVHRSIGPGGLFFFFATLAAVVVSANLRIHLWFSSRVYPDQLAEQRADTSRWIRFADCAFVALLVAGGLLLPEDQAGWAALLISVGIGSAVAFLIIEPATARAAFRRSP